MPPETIEITLDGQVLPTLGGGRPAWPVRVAAAAILVAVLAALALGGVILLWAAAVLIPVLLVAGLVAYVAFRLQLWRIGRAVNRHGGPEF
jgi:hypothetical protein